MNDIAGFEERDSASQQDGHDRQLHDVHLSGFEEASKQAAASKEPDVPTGAGPQGANRCARVFPDKSHVRVLFRCQGRREQVDSPPRWPAWGARLLRQLVSAATEQRRVEPGEEGGPVHGRVLDDPVDLAFRPGDVAIKARRHAISYPAHYGDPEFGFQSSRSCRTQRSGSVIARPAAVIASAATRKGIACR